MTLISNPSTSVSRPSDVSISLISSIPSPAPTSGMNL